MHEPLQERSKSFLDLLLRGGRYPRHGAPVKGILEGEDFVAAGLVPEFPRKLDQPLIGLRSAIAEEYLAAPGELDEAPRKLGLRRGAVQIRGVNKSCGLFRHNLGDFRMRVPERAHSDTRTEVQILPASEIPDAAARTSRDIKFESPVGGHYIVGVKRRKRRHWKLVPRHTG